MQRPVRRAHSMYAVIGRNIACLLSFHLPKIITEAFRDERFTFRDERFTFSETRNIDRCGKHLGTILNFLRDGSVPLPETKQELLEYKFVSNFNYDVSNIIMRL